MLEGLKRFPLVAVLVLATGVAACGDDDPTGNDDNPAGTTTVTFTYEEPAGIDVSAVSVPGEFNTPDQWTPTDPDFQMEEVSEGNWELTVELAPGTYQYKYHFNGDTWPNNMCDDATFGDENGDISPQAEGCHPTNFGNAIITVVSDDD